MILVCALAPPEARGGDAYLPFIGPPPLRFETAAPGASPAAKMLPANSPSSPATNAMVSPAAAVPAATKAVAAATTSVETNSTAAAGGQSTGQPMIVPLPVNDLTVVTPRMLADYLKPVAGAGREGALAASPGKINFQPPTPQPELQSRATYKTQ